MELFEQLKQNIGNEIVEYNAVWKTSNPIKIDGKRKCRFEVGDMVPVKNFRLASGKPTHEILGCYGTLESKDIKMMVIDPLTQTLSIITL